MSVCRCFCVVARVVGDILTLLFVFVSACRVGDCVGFGGGAVLLRAVRCCCCGRWRAVAVAPALLLGEQIPDCVCGSVSHTSCPPYSLVAVQARPPGSGCCLAVAVQADVSRYVCSCLVVVCAPLLLSVALCPFSFCSPLLTTLFCSVSSSVSLTD